MLSLLILQSDKIYSDISRFEPLNEAANIAKLFGEKYAAKLLKMYANNDRICRRTTTLAVNYHDGQPYAKLSLLPI